MLKLADIFADHMVLQRGKPVAIWGQAPAGTCVTVSVQQKTATATAGADGAWQVTVGPLTASFCEEMTVQTDFQTLVLRDVQVGEVWLAGGQSNMEFHMLFDVNYEQELPHCSDDALRFYDVPEISYPGQDQEADYSLYGCWRKASPHDLARFSAVGYWFARRLRRRCNVPLGIIGCNWGGTPACAWMSTAAIRAGGGQCLLDEYAAAVKNLDLSAYEQAFRTNPDNYRTDLIGNPIKNKMTAGAGIEDILEELKVQNTSAGEAAAWQPPVGPRYERRPSGLYESMLQPLVPYGLRGVIWYQGETDGDTHPELYSTLFPALIADWRACWGEEFPFLFVQLAPLEQWMQCNGTPYAIIRTAQQHTADTVPGTGMAVITDAGMRWDIHPKAKRPVGERLALLAQSIAYKENILCEAPTLDSVQPAEGSLTLTFRNAGEGLHLSYMSPYGEALPGDRLTALTITQNGKTVNPNILSARAFGNSVILTGAALHAGPTEVGIAQGAWYQVNLYNSEGIPARPAVLRG